ncbi:MAG: hypothetical protein IH926_00410 [Proteobacteria bacterium]|nr:hypothetical protein [Pseudomonadota bacterium]
MSARSISGFFSGEITLPLALITAPATRASTSIGQGARPPSAWSGPRTAVSSNPVLLITPMISTLSGAVAPSARAVTLVSAISVVLPVAPSR